MKHSSIISLPVPQVIVACGHKCYTHIGWYIIDFNSKKEFKSYFQDALFDLSFENDHGYIYIVDEDGEKIDKEDNEPIRAKMLFNNQKEDLTLMRQYPITSECGITKIRKSEFKVLFKVDEVITAEVIRNTLDAQRLFYLPEKVDFAMNPDNVGLFPHYLSKFNLKTSVKKLVLNVSINTEDEDNEEPSINSLFFDMGQELCGKDESMIYWPEGLFPRNTTYEISQKAFVMFLKEWEDFVHCEVELNVEWDYISDPIKEPRIIAFKNSIRKKIGMLRNEISVTESCKK